MKRTIQIAGIEELHGDPSSDKGVCWTVEDYRLPPDSSEWPVYYREGFKDTDEEEWVKYYELKWALDLSRENEHFEFILTVPFDVDDKSHALSCKTQIPKYVYVGPHEWVDADGKQHIEHSYSNTTVRFPEGQQVLFDNILYSNVTPICRRLGLAATVKSCMKT